MNRARRDALLREAKQFLGYRYVLHPLYRIQVNPWHGVYIPPDVRQTFARVRMRHGLAR